MKIVEVCRNKPDILVAESVKKSYSIVIVNALNAHFGMPGMSFVIKEDDYLLNRAERPETED